jgi:tetratricopeptide (TPR) repeat protein
MNSPDTEELLHLSLDAINNDRHPEAISLLKTLLEREPNHVFGTYLLAAEHAQIGMMDRAEAGFRRTVELAPDFAMGRFQLGQLYLTQARSAEAKAVLAPLASLPVDQALAGYTKGLIAAADEDVAGAIAHIQAGLGCAQEIPALEADMRRVVANLQALQGQGGAAQAAPAPGPAATPLFLSNYGKTDN